MSRFNLERAIDLIESSIETGWDFFAKPYTDLDVLKDFGTCSIADEDYQITNSMMKDVVALIVAARVEMVAADKASSEAQFEIRSLRQRLEKAHDYASMSDPRIAGELDKEITYYELHEGEEDLVYGPVQLLRYCRDRLRSRR